MSVTDKYSYIPNERIKLSTRKDWPFTKPGEYRFLVFLDYSNQGLFGSATSPL